MFLFVFLFGCESGTTGTDSASSRPTEAEMAARLEASEERGTLVNYAPQRTGIAYRWRACTVTDVYVYSSRTVVWVKGCNAEYFTAYNKNLRGPLAGVAAQAFIGRKKLWFNTTSGNTWSSFAL